MTITGNLGTVMKESATIALEYIKANAKLLGLDSEILSIHLHVQKALHQRRSKCWNCHVNFISFFVYKTGEENLAMTGEITLRGKVLPVGGIKRKFLRRREPTSKKLSCVTKIK
jgi:ATP-dependent Lon protease